MEFSVPAAGYVPNTLEAWSETEQEPGLHVSADDDEVQRRLLKPGLSLSSSRRKSRGAWVA